MRCASQAVPRQYPSLPFTPVICKDGPFMAPSPTDPEPYGLEQPQLLGPPLPGEVAVAPDLDRLLDLVVVDLVAHAINCVRQFGDFHLALSGGSTPQPLYELLMIDPDARALPWRRTHLWIVDERCVPFDDERSNFRAIHETIVEHADIPIEQVHAMPPLTDDGDREYERQLREALAWREKGQDRLDYVLLGMGGDGHTASLFPHHPALNEDQRLVLRVHADSAAPPDRITMTYPLINASRFIAVLVAGKAKAAMIQRIAHGLEPACELPIKGINPHAGRLKWYLDAQAAGLAPGGHAAPPT